MQQETCHSGHRLCTLCMTSEDVGAPLNKRHNLSRSPKGMLAKTLSKPALSLAHCTAGNLRLDYGCHAALDRLSNSITTHLRKGLNRQQHMRQRQQPSGFKSPSPHQPQGNLSAKCMLEVQDEATRNVDRRSCELDIIPCQGGVEGRRIDC